MSQAISYRAIDRIFKSKINGDISREGINCVIDFLESICEYIADKCVKELIKENKLRKFHNQYNLRRIPSSIYKSLCEVLYKQITDFNTGDVGDASKSVTTTSSIEADEERWYHA